MMRQYELVDRVRKYNPHADEELLNRAYVYAMKAHGAQKRASGDPYFSHPLEVAAILTDMHLDDATIVAAVLHDTIEDTESTREDIDRIFGREIGKLVDGLTKLRRLDLVSKRAEQAENFRKLLLAIADDVRVLLVKLADRLHNMRTLQFVPADKRKRVAEETLDIYAPLAGRMGMQGVRDELEDLAFSHLMPEARAMIVSRLADLRKRNGQIIRRIEKALAEELHARGISAEVKGREKSPYSVFRKMERSSIAFEQLSDIFGFRVIVKTVEDCYRVIGVVHTKWPVVPGRFKDYISTPKQNDYRSLHTTVIGPGSQRVELQVRTAWMHEVAEYGIAAHTLYKDGQVPDSTTLSHESRAYQWLRRTIELLGEGDSPEEFLEHTKLEMFLDQVFCFTPKGRLIALPRGATPLDFAYAVHTDIGNSAVGAKINGRIAPLLSELHNGDEVEIARAEGQVPPAAWESLVVTGKARSAIRRATRDAVRSQYAGLGRQIIIRAFERADKAFSEEKLKAALPRLARQSVDDVMAAVGRGEIYSGDVVRAVHPDFKEERKAGASPSRDEGGWFGLKKAASLVFKVPGAEPVISENAIPIRGLNSDLPVRFAPNGGAVPGDRIVGILTPGEGITIYPIQSPALTAFDDQPERWLDVRWDLDQERKDLFPAQISVTAINEPGALGTIATIIGEAGANIDHVSFVTRSPDFRDIVLDLEVWDLKHLSSVISQLRTKSVVSRVERVNG
ncbi:MAG TPA: bifunctional (p)ppGpp synthetase/guanosine-3',5'-bis(diphosphate) 3'-pyrophosphohydrolase [Beijerinckiaceae bacterium]|jgi:GTP pyrophosphokinase|nr:bifunctional (p)ppGpp synthetase/guanosine-3',5'-bis(diphosphate) 3'-pyrophosphohydrolase [Beijerinckiaceae bacterium]